MQTTPYVIRAVDRRAVQRTRRVGWRQRMVSGWSGFRGAVSLATALAVPATVAGGAPFPDRDLIVFVAAVVILLTILVQGTTLPLVVRWARLPEDTGRAEELALARVRAAEAGLAALPRLAADLGVDGEHLDRLRTEYEEYRELAADDAGETGGDPGPGPAAAARRALGEAAGGHRPARRQRDRRHRAARAAGGDGRRGGPVAGARVDRCAVCARVVACRPTSAAASGRRPCDVAVSLAREAGALQLRERPGVTVRATKAHVNDLVSDVDLASERLIADALSALPARRRDPRRGGPRHGGDERQALGRRPARRHPQLRHGDRAVVGVDRALRRRPARGRRRARPGRGRDVHRRRGRRRPTGRRADRGLRGVARRGRRRAELQPVARDEAAGGA